MTNHHRHKLYEPHLNSMMRNNRWKNIFIEGQKQLISQLPYILDLDIIKKLRQKVGAESVVVGGAELSIQAYLDQLEMIKTQDVSVIARSGIASRHLWYEAVYQALHSGRSQIRYRVICNLDKVPNQVLKEMLEYECWENLRYGQTNMPYVKEIFNAVWKQDPSRISQITHLYSSVAFVNWWPRRIDCVAWPKAASDQRLMIRTRPRLLKHMTVQHVTKNLSLDGAQWCRLLKELADCGHVIDYLPPGMLTWINKSVFTNTLKGRSGQKRVPQLPASVSERPA